MQSYFIYLFFYLEKIAPISKAHFKGKPKTKISLTFIIFAYIFLFVKATKKTS